MPRPLLSRALRNGGVAVLSLVLAAAPSRADFGFEVELGRRVTDADGKDFTGKPTVLLDGHDGTTGVHLFRAENDHRTTSDDVKYSNFEMVSDPMNQLWGTKPDEAVAYLFATLDTMKGLSDQFYVDDDPHALGSYKGIGSVYRLRAKPSGIGTWGDALVNPKIKGALPAPWETSARGLFNHYSVGVPLRNMIAFMTWLAADGRTYDEPARKQLLDAIDYGTKGAATSGISDDGELAGALALFYTQIGAFATKTGGGPGPNGDRAAKDGQIKNMTALLSRASLREIRQTLQPNTRAWLDHNSEALITAMAKYFEKENVDFHDIAVRQVGDLDEVRLVDYARSAFSTGGDEIDQERVFGGMTTVSPHDRQVLPDGTTVTSLIVVELRSFRKQITSWDELAAYSKEILLASRKIILGHD